MLSLVSLLQCQNNPGAKIILELLMYHAQHPQICFSVWHGHPVVFHRQIVFTIIFKWVVRGWRDGSVANSIYCSWKGPRSSSQHQHCSSQSSATLRGSLLTSTSTTLMLCTTIHAHKHSCTQTEIKSYSKVSWVSHSTTGKLAQ